MALNRQAFIANYIEETSENISRVDLGIIALKKHPESVEDLNVTLRALHTIKGSSRMLKFRTMERIAHGMENLFKGFKEGRYKITKPLVQLIFIGTERLQEGINEIKQSQTDEIPVDDLLGEIEKAYGNETFSPGKCRRSGGPSGGKKPASGAASETAAGTEVKLGQKTAADGKTGSGRQQAEGQKPQTRQQTGQEPSQQTRPQGETSQQAETKPQVQTASGGGAKGGAESGSGGVSDSKPAAPTKAGPAEAGQVETGQTAAGQVETGGAAKSGAGVSGQAGTGGTPEYESIRIRIDKINGMVKDVNSLILRQFRMKKLGDELQELERLFRESVNDEYGDIEHGEHSNSIQNVYKKRMKMLGRLTNVRKSFSEESVQIESRTLELQEDILQLRMLPLELILGSLEKMVMENAMAMDKEVRFTMSGTDVLIDKAILEKLGDPILHIVRNSVDHGIEPPAERKKAGKPQQGSIDISCSYEGGNIIISISDDGRGVHYEAIKQKALSLGYLSTEDAEEISENELLNYLFYPGFSTAGKVTDFSGRGVGLDIVKHNIEYIKGKISINSVQGQGTEFSLSLPLSLATVEGFFVRCGEHTFFLPSNFIQKIQIVEEEEKIDYLQHKGFMYEDKIIPLYSLGRLIGQNGKVEKNFVVVVESYGEVMGMQVDEVIQHSSLIYKAMPPDLQGLRAVQGIVYDESFKNIPILYIPDIMARFRNMKSIELKKRVWESETTGKRVLVIDDSLNTREIEKSILEIENFEVDTAIDGIEALEKMRKETYNLVVTDLNMPRMDGYTLIENLRKEEHLKSIPIIVVSSIDEESYRNSVLELGADAYIVKSNFDRNDLATAAHNLLAKG